jgi:predicted nucleic acid-binding Zn ribbon protein
MDRKTAEELIMQYVVLSREFGVQSWQARCAAREIKKRFKRAADESKGNGLYADEKRRGKKGK